MKVGTKIRLKKAYLAGVTPSFRISISGVLIIYATNGNQIFASVDGKRSSNGVVCRTDDVYKA